MRQRGGSQAQFQDALQRLRTRETKQNNQVLFMTRCRATLSQTKRLSFQDAVRLYRKRLEVSKLNYQYIRNFSRPIIIAHVKHNKDKQAKVLTTNSSNLYNKLLLYIRARVILLYNIQIERGLVNGATSTIKNILQSYTI